jgi:glycosyltransferase involved in cell wall biosynthesis
LSKKVSSNSLTGIVLILRYKAVQKISKSRLLFVVNSDWAFLSHRLPIALKAIEEGYDVHIATPITETHNLKKFTQYGLTVHSLYINRKSTGFISNLRSLLNLFKIIKKVNPDLIHLITIKPVLLGGILARCMKIPTMVIAITGLGFVYSSDRISAKLLQQLANLLYKFVFSHPQVIVIFQNEDDKNRLMRITHLPENKTIMTRGSGVVLENYQATPLTSGKPIVMMASRLLIEKGVREFVQAAFQIVHSGYTVRFALVGKCDTGNPESLSEKELEEWISKGFIEYWGYQTIMPPILSQASMVVLPSYYREGLPKVLLEAAACGRAVITTDMPGCRDAIEPEVTGLLVPARDIKSLIKAIKYLLDDPVRCREMGKSGRMLAEREFDINKVIDAHIAVYRNLVQ